jgi:cell division protein FtsZ
MNESPVPAPAASSFSPVAVIGVGRAGATMVAQVRAAGVPAEACLAVFSRHTRESSPAETGVFSLPPTALEPFNAGQPTSLATLEPGLGEAVRRACAGRLWVLVLTGLGGRTGSLLAPLIVAEARQVCERVVGFATLPARDEASERILRARRAFKAVAQASEGIFCLPHDHLAETVDAHGPLAATFELPGQLLAGAAHGFWRMLTVTPVIRLHADELRQHLRGHTCETFAAVDAAGGDRARLAVENLLAHPLLARGAALRGTRVVVNVVGGPDLTRADLREVVQRLEAVAEGVRVVLCAGTAPGLSGRLGLTIFARNDAVATEPELETDQEEPSAPAAPRFIPANELTGASLLGTRTQSQTTEGARIETTGPTTRRRGGKPPQQAQLPLDLLQRGRFEKSEPTIHNGENLDLPTYIRRGITLN